MTDFQPTTIVTCDTTAGPFTMHLVREWSPNGYDRAVELFKRGFFDGSHFYRVLPHFLVQFGISYTNDPELLKFANKNIPDDQKFDPPMKFKEGTISYAGSGPNSRTSQLFISYGSVPSLGRELWETPIGEVIEGMESIRGLYSAYGDMPPWGHGPVQGMIHRDGKAYIEEQYPKLDSFISCLVTEEEADDENTSDEEEEADEITSEEEEETDGEITSEEEADESSDPEAEEFEALDLEGTDEVVKVEPFAGTERIGSPTKKDIASEEVVGVTAGAVSDMNTIFMVSGGIFLAVSIFLGLAVYTKRRRAKFDKSS
uniref:PPIase cyclophilin-type domain-containing protein n=1 Tax=Leptocylindrus danicus TaxID=163516 RepID=A0A7S2LII9_9STRA|mmetsp:Transcript_5839/g.8608  ORF Transcript_5839/g.8608 Transcript_5839/m.8608 type:complete len:315 (+) Transcript_5839:31-975(+)